MLRVWIPGTKDDRDYGLDGVQLTNANVTMNTAGKLGSCLSFVATQSSRLYRTNFDLGNKWTVCCWGKYNSAAAQYLFSLGNAGTSNQMQLAMRVVSANSVKVMCNTNSADLTIPATVTDWVHYCMVNDGTTCKLYVNGVYVQQISASTYYAGHTLSLGVYYSSNWFSGWINDFRLYDEVLSPKEIEIISRGLVRHYQLCDPTEDQMNNNAITNSEPYQYRMTGGGDDVSNCKSNFTTIVGGSLCWNQIIPQNSTGRVLDGITFANDGNGTWTVTGTSTSNNSFCNINYVNSTTHRLLQNHVYYISGSSVNVRVQLVCNGSPAILQTIGTKDSQLRKLGTITGNASWVRLQVGTNNLTVNEKIHPIVIDLTMMFGQEVADYFYSLGEANGAIYFEKFFPNQNYAYSDYTLQHVSGLQNITRKGKNLIDAFGFNTTTINGITFTRDGAGPDTIVVNGTSASGTTPQVYCTFTPKITGQYLFSGCPSGGSTGGYDIYCWDTVANARAKGWDKTTNSASDYGNGNVQIWLEAGRTYALGCRISGNKTVNNIVFKPMIRFASVTDATFEPRAITTNPLNYNVALDSNVVLRGIPKLDANNNLYFDGDTYSADGTVTRKYGIVDLGTLTWNHATTNRAKAYISDIKIPESSNLLINCITQNNYKQLKSSQTLSAVGEYAVVNSNQLNLFFYYDGTDPSGYFVYELATPTTEFAAPFKNPLPVDSYGSEEFVTTGIVPVGHESKYLKNAVDGKIGMTFHDYLTNIGVYDDIEYDVSGYWNNGIKNGDFISSSDTPRYKLSTLFTGDQYITAESLPAETKTISCWVKTTKSKSTSQIIIGDYNSRLCISLYSGKFISYFSNSGYSTGSKCTLGSEYKENDWNHFVVVATGSGTRDVYCNGIKLAPTTDDYWNSASGLTIGKRNSSSSQPFYGYLSDFRAYATALTQEQVLDLYHSSASLANNGTLLSYEFVEGGDES